MKRARPSISRRRRLSAHARRALALGCAIALASCVSEANPAPASELPSSPSASTSDATPSETDAGSTTIQTAAAETEQLAPTEAIDEVRRIETADGERQYYLHAPPNATAVTRPIVIVLHGHGGSSAQVRGAEIGRSPMQVWFEIAEREQIVLAFPDGAVGSDDAQGWNDCRRDAWANPDTDDVAFIADVIDDSAGIVAIDRSRVFTVGVSNGGFMSMRMAVERPEVVAGAAAIVASMASDSECVAPTEPVSVLLMNGTADRLVAFEGGQVPFRRGGAMATPAAADLWRTLADAQPQGEPEAFPDIDPDDGSTVSRSRWSGSATVWLYTIDGGGHTEPSVVERYSPVWTNVVGPQNHDIEAAEEIWSFFLAASS